MALCGRPARSGWAPLRSASTTLTAMAVTASAVGAASTAPWALGRAEWLLPLLLQGKGSGRLVPVGEARGPGMDGPGADHGWLGWGSDVVLLLPACLGPVAAAALLWWPGCLVCLGKGRARQRLLDLGRRGGGSVGGRVVCDQALASSKCSQVSEQGAGAVALAARSGITGAACSWEGRACKSEAGGPHGMGSGGSGQYTVLLLRVCACAAFGAAGLGLDFAPYYTQVSARAEPFVTWHLETLQLCQASGWTLSPTHAKILRACVVRPRTLELDMQAQRIAQIRGGHAILFDSKPPLSPETKAVLKHDNKLLATAMRFHYSVRTCRIPASWKQEDYLLLNLRRQ